LGHRTDPRRAGMAYGLFHVATELGRGAGSLPGGLLFEALPGAPFWLTACLAGSLALWGWLEMEPSGSSHPKA
jgi:predicted MFS family arabinose efflux permease